MKHKKRHRRQPKCSTVQPLTVDIIVKIRGITSNGFNKMKMKVPFLSLIALSIGAVFGVSGRLVEAAALGELTWNVSDPSIATIQHDAAGNVYLQPTGKSGSIVVFVTGDSDTSTLQAFAGTLEVEYLDDEVAVVEIKAAITDQAAVELVLADPAPDVNSASIVDADATVNPELTVDPATSV